MTELDKITKDKFQYLLEVLPPLIYGRRELIRFLETLDGNKEVALILKEHEPDEAFMQGEGHDNHNIYMRVEDTYYSIGRTNKAWNTEMFRYNDWNKMDEAELKRYNPFVGW